MNKQSALRPVMDVGSLPMNMANEERVEGQDGPEAIDIAAMIRQIWSAVYRNRLLMASIVGAAVLLGVVATMLTTPKFSATASIQIDQQQTKVLGTEDSDPAGALEDADRFLQTQIDVLKSRSLAIRVVDSLNLAVNDRFITAMGEKPVDKPAGTLSLADSKREQVISTVENNMTVNLPRNSRVANISFKSPDPNVAMTVANSFATNFIEANLKRKFDTSAYARQFLQSQLVDAKQRLEESERATLDYARTVGLIDASAGVGVTSDPSSSGPRSLVTSDLVQLNNAYATARAARIASQQRWSQAMSTPLLNLPEVLANPAISQLSQLRAQAQASYDQERQRHKPDFPSLQQLAAQIAGFDRQIDRLATSIRDSIRDEYQTSLKQEGALDGSVDQLKRDTLSEQDKSVRYNILKRETDTNRTMYDGLLQRYKEISAQAGISSNNISLIDVASIPTAPVSPKPLLNLLASALVGLVAASVLVLLREKFDDAVRSPEDVQRKLGLSFLNSVPLLRPGETPQESMADPRSAMSESYAALRTSIELANSDGMPESLLFTSSRSGEGKSTSAYAIARDFARLGKRVVLIDADLRRPSLHRTLGVPNNNGFASVLARHRTLAEVLQRTDVPNLAFLSTGPLPPNPAELLSGPLLRQLLSTLREDFDLIVIDGPPVLGLADAVILGANVASAVFVIEANGSHHGHAKSAIRRMQSSGVSILGALLTKYDARKVGYGYEYGYYSYNYGVDIESKRKKIQ